MPTQEKKLIWRLEARNEKLTKALDRSERRFKRFADSTRRSNKRAADSFNRLNVQAAAALAIFGSQRLLRGIVRTSDQYTLLSNRLKLVVDSEQELIGLENKLFAAAQATRSEYAGTVELYARVARNADNLGLSQERLLRLTQATNQAIQIGGATTQEASAGVVQFSQALASGELRGDELRSVLENLPRLANAIADGLQTDIGGLRDLAEQGELTADRVTQALLSHAGAIEQEFGQLDRTVGQALTQLQNQFSRDIAQTDLSPLVDEIDRFRQLISDPQTIKNIQTLANAIVRAFSAATKAISETVEFTRFLGEELARQIGGAAVGDLVGLEREYDKLQKRLEGLNIQIEALGTSSPPRVAQLRDAVIEVNKALEETEKKIRATKELAADRAALGRIDVEPVSLDLPEPLSPIDPKATKEIDKALKAYQKTLDGLRTPQQVFNQQVNQARQLLEAGKINVFEYRLGVTAYAKALFEASANNEEFNQKLQRATEITEAARTPLENMVLELQELQMLLDEDFITQETFDRTIAGFNNMSDAAEESTDKMSVFADEAARNMQSAFADFLFDPFEDGIRGLIENFARALQRMAAEAAAAKIFEALGVYGGSSGGGGSSSDGGFAQLFDTLYAGGYASGGYIPQGKIGLVGENGPELAMGGLNVMSNRDLRKMGQTVNISFPGLQINADNPSSIRRSQGEIARSATRGVQEAQRYS